MANVILTDHATFEELGADPAAVANKGKLYAKDGAGITEAFYRNDAGAGAQDEIVWPIAGQIRCIPSLEEAIGLKSNETIGIKYDDDSKDPEPQMTGIEEIKADANGDLKKEKAIR